MKTEGNSEGYKPRGTIYTFPQYAIISLILTPIIAYSLAFYGYIPFDPLFSAIAGIGVAAVYVSYRGYYWTLYRKDERKQAESSEDDTLDQ